MHENMKPGTLKLYLSTSNLEAAYNECKAKGVKVNEVKNDLYGPGSGVKWFEITDPAGCWFNPSHLNQWQMPGHL